MSNTGWGTLPVVACTRCHQLCHEESRLVKRVHVPPYYNGVFATFTRIWWSCGHRHKTRGAAELCAHYKRQHPRIHAEGRVDACA